MKYRLMVGDCKPENPGADREDGRHIVLTGASSGIGAALALAYAAPGVRLSLLARDPVRLAAVAAEAVARGAEVESALVDVTDAEAVRAWILAADDARPIDVLIANAGIGGITAMAPATGEGLETARRIFEVNTLGVVNTLAPLLPRLCPRGSGRIAVVASLAGSLGLPHSPAYCGSKAGARIYAEGLRALLAPRGVSVTVVDPGFVDTPMLRSLPFVPPSIWDAERAARHIRSAIDAGRRRCAFPRSLVLLTALARLLPAAIVDAVLLRNLSRGRRS